LVSSLAKKSLSARSLSSLLALPSLLVRSTKVPRAAKVLRVRGAELLVAVAAVVVAVVDEPDVVGDPYVTSQVHSQYSIREC
jgi:hypothetical protein